MRQPKSRLGLFPKAPKELVSEWESCGGEISANVKTETFAWSSHHCISCLVIDMITSITITSIVSLIWYFMLRIEKLHIENLRFQFIFIEVHFWHIWLWRPPWKERWNNSLGDLWCGRKLSSALLSSLQLQALAVIVVLEQGIEGWEGPVCLLQPVQITVTSLHPSRCYNTCTYNPSLSLPSPLWRQGWKM